MLLSESSNYISECESPALSKDRHADLVVALSAPDRRALG
jgi:hypothetical protein